jgi:HEAT repeat protein
VFRLGISRKIATLARRIESGALADRRAAASELYDLCVEDGAGLADDAMQVLVRMLVDRDEEISHSGMYAIGRCGAQGLTTLLRLLEDPDPYVRARSCEAIANGKMARQAAQAPLLAALADPAASVRSRAAFALGLLDGSSAAIVDALAALARDREAEVRGWALHALGNIGRRGHVPGALPAHAATMLDALADPDERVRGSASQALAATGLPGARILSMLDARLRADPGHGWQGLLGPLAATAEREDLAPHLGALVELAANYPPTRLTVFGICKEFGPRAAALVPLIEQELAAEDSDVLALAEALWRICGRADSAIPRLTSMLEGDMHEALRAGTLLVSITGDGRSIVPMLERALEESPDEPCMAIQQIGPPVAGVAPALARAIDDNLEETDWDVMWGLASALACVESPEPVATQALVKSMTHPSGTVRAAALDGLRRLGPAARAALPALRAAMKDGDAAWKREVRAAIIAIERSPN